MDFLQDLGGNYLMNRLKRLLIGISDPILRSNRRGMSQSIDSVRQKVISHKKKSKLAQILYNGTNWLRDFNIPMRDMYRQLNLKKTQWWSKNELEALQNKYLRHLIKHAYQHVPFYHKLFQKRGLRPDDIKTKDDLVKLPITTKKLMRNNYDWFSCPVYRLGTFKSSGTSGTPWRYHWSHLWIQIWENIIWRGWNWAGYTKGKRMASFLSGSLGNVALAPAGMIAGGNVNTVKLENLIQQLKAYKPQHFYVFPKAAYIVAKYLLEQNDYSIQVESVITTSEPLYDWQREVIEEVFQCKVFDEWGSNDGANTAHECSEHCGMHHAAERNIIEIVDGRIIATDLWNYALPFIRYENGDAGIWLDECPCGRKLPLLKVYGRKYDFIFTKTEIIFPNIIWYRLLNFAVGIDSLQIVQKSLDSIELKVVKGRNFSDFEFQRAIAEVKDLLKGMDVKVSFLDKIPLTPAGKWRNVINETKKDISDYLST